jgi:hypothetical protein
LVGASVIALSVFHVIVSRETDRSGQYQAQGRIVHVTRHSQRLVISTNQANPNISNPLHAPFRVSRDRFP